MARGKSGLEFHPEERQIGEGVLPTIGEVKRDGLIKEVEPHTDMSRFRDKAEELAFMEEPVEIYLNAAANQNDEPVVEVGVNGDTVYLVRNQNHTIRRKHVLVLATAKPTTYRTVEGVDRDGARTINLRSMTSVKYPFAVIKDSPRGMAWFQQLQQNAR